MNNWLRCGVCLGLGVVLGAAGAILFSKNPQAVKKGCATLLSHVMDLKEKATTVMETAKETIEDVAAEAKFDSDTRKKSETGKAKV